MNWPESRELPAITESRASRSGQTFPDPCTASNVCIMREQDDLLADIEAQHDRLAQERPQPQRQPWVFGARPASQPALAPPRTAAGPTGVPEAPRGSVPDSAAAGDVQTSTDAPASPRYPWSMPRWKVFTELVALLATKNAPLTQLHTFVAALGLNPDACIDYAGLDQLRRRARQLAEVGFCRTYVLRCLHFLLFSSSQACACTEAPGNQAQHHQGVLAKSGVDAGLHCHSESVQKPGP